MRPHLVVVGNQNRGWRLVVKDGLALTFHPSTDWPSKGVLGFQKYYRPRLYPPHDGFLEFAKR